MFTPMKKVVLATALTLASTQVSANDISNTLSKNGIYLGLQSNGWYAGGLSAKMDLNDKLTAQAILGVGTFTTVTGRGLYKFMKQDKLDVYGYGSLGFWHWGGDRYYDSESSMTFGAGAGIEYDLRGLGAQFTAPVFVSSELGLNVVSFDNYGSVSALGFNIGIHYKF